MACSNKWRMQALPHYPALAETKSSGEQCGIRAAPRWVLSHSLGRYQDWRVSTPSAELEFIRHTTESVIGLPSSPTGLELGSSGFYYQTMSTVANVLNENQAQSRR